MDLLAARIEIDLAVWGLSERATLDARVDIEDLPGTSVDLVQAESTSASLVARIARDGIEVP